MNARDAVIATMACMEFIQETGGTVPEGGSARFAILFARDKDGEQADPYFHIIDHPFIENIRMLPSKKRRADKFVELKVRSCGRVSFNSREAEWWSNIINSYIAFEIKVKRLA